ncbi:hypothetical protein L6R53_06920 [Myxococcota bacterium]|nr:hypothetical protein [Myxococcota bacterium]
MPQRPYRPRPIPLRSFAPALLAGLLSLGLAPREVAAPDADVPLLPAAGVPAPTVAVADPQPATQGPALPCDGGEASPLDVLATTALDLARARIAYNSEAFSDCSGIMHRMLGQVAQRCDGARTPSPEVARSSRELAAWFDARGLLVPVPQVEDADRWLVPGAITFYTPPRQRAVDRVVHTAVVVDVERDDQGRVLGMTLFHGRQPGTVASYTDWHRRDGPLPLGNGDEALFAVAFAHPDLALDAPALRDDGLADLGDESGATGF